MAKIESFRIIYHSTTAFIGKSVQHPIFAKKMHYYAINRLTLTFNELKHKNVLCDAQVKFDLLVLLHWSAPSRYLSMFNASLPTIAWPCGPLVRAC